MSNSKITFATMNLENLQLPDKKIYGREGYNKNQYQKKIDWIVQKIVELDADVIGLQEIWAKECLEDVFNSEKINGLYEFFCDKTDGKSISVAAAVRRPLKGNEATWIKEMPDELILNKRKKYDKKNYAISLKINEFSRPVLRMEITPIKGEKFLLFVTHLKSKCPMELDKDEKNKDEVKIHSKALGSALSTIRRTAEAAGLRILLNKVMRGTDIPVVVTGDLNDAQLSVTTEIITEKPSYKPYMKSRAGQKSDRGLYSVATLQEYRSLRDVYYTYIHKNIRESLDHILVSEQFYDHSNKRIWSFNSMRILNDHLDMKETSAKHSAYSDHAPVSATFDYNPI